MLPSTINGHGHEFVTVILVYIFINAMNVICYNQVSFHQ